MVQFASQIAKSFGKADRIGRIVADPTDRHQGSGRLCADDKLPGQTFGRAQEPEHESTHKPAAAAGGLSQIGEGKEQRDNAHQRRPFVVNRQFPVHHTCSNHVREHYAGHVEGVDKFFSHSGERLGAISP